jgi:four helix bundle protein
MSKSIIGQKSYELALGAIRLHPVLERQQIPMLPSRFLQCATAIGALVEEGLGSRSDKEFFIKFATARKEAREAQYWLRLMQESAENEAAEIKRLLSLVDELVRMLTSATITLEKKLKPR